MTNDTKYSIIKIALLGEGVFFKRGGIQMPEPNKIIQKMKRQPNGIRFQELVKVLEYNGYKMKARKRHFS